MICKSDGTLEIQATVGTFGQTMGRSKVWNLAGNQRFEVSQMVKQEAGILFLSTLLALSLAFPTAFAAGFDDTTGYWAQKYISKLAEKGAIPPSSDGKFKPTEPITRADLAVWLIKVMGLEKQPVAQTPSFPDVKTTDPYFNAVEIMRQNNLISGYSDGFRPKQFIQRGEMITIISRALNAPKPDEAAIESELSRFSDRNKIPQWARQGIAVASKQGVLIGQDPEKVDATAIATRGDTAAMLCALDEVLAEESATDTNTAGATSQKQPGSPGPQYQGQVQAQTTAQPNYAAIPPQGYPAQQPPGGYLPAPGYQPAQIGYQPPQYGGYPGAAPMLQGSVTTIAAGTAISGALKNSIDSGSTQVGEPVEVSLPAGAGGLPPGTMLIGSVTNVVSAARFKFGANGKVDIKFTSCVTPDGRRFPLSASIDTNQIHLTGGSTMGRVGKGALTTAVGAGGGAALGTALGAIVGATSDGRVGKATGMGAVFGTAIGGGVGLVGAGVRKGSEVKITAGTNLPITIDQSFQIAPLAAGAPYGQPAYGQPYGAPYGTPPAYAAPPYGAPAYGAPPQYGTPPPAYGAPYGGAPQVQPPQ
jgi:hypothetical protein